MDVKSVFLNGNSKRKVYVQQPLGLESSEFPNHVCKLGKALYEVKQAPRAWYLKGTSSLGRWYLKCLGFDLKGYLSSDYVECIMKIKSTSGACELLRGKLVRWSVKKQKYVAMSFAEAELVADAGCCANILWMKSWLCDYAIMHEKVPIFYDNASAIATSNNLVLHSTTKHIDIRYNVLRDLILHHSSINNSASLSNKFGKSYFIVKFGISGLLHHVVTTIADRIRGFPVQSVRSSNVEELDSPYLLVLFIGTSQSRQHSKSESDSYYLSD
uniref:Uncharacterized mitochondrial protein AtMg00810-like n=1 Tax=Tanacetum cinerariifolium TaxID=118510 RepID=A0A6L2M334_TANCI|nr:uncharacterized mitochondrial protein AtMg00810-like [Tanacetum cinerariifolium]